MLRLLAAFSLLTATLFPQEAFFSNLIADSLRISLPADSGAVPVGTIRIRDERRQPGNVVGIRQIKKYRYIPVDQYFVLDRPLADYLAARMAGTLDDTTLTLEVEHLDLWYDYRTLFSKGWLLNGSTRLTDGAGEVIDNWQWELRRPKVRKKELADTLGQMLDTWLEAQATALTADRPAAGPAPFAYRRQLFTWVDFIVLPDGYIIDGHLALDYSADQQVAYRRGRPGFYYRRSAHHESIAIGGKDLQSYRRLSPAWLWRRNVTLRMGFNSFDPDHFDYVDWWNIFLINLGLTTSLEYRPVYLRGLFAGAGLHVSANALPEVVNRVDIGLLLSVGIVLP